MLRHVIPSAALVLAMAGLFPLDADDATGATVTSAYGVHGVVLWVSADYGVTADPNGSVTAVTDKSGNFTFTARNGNRGPTAIAKGLNDQPVLRFNGNQSLYSAAGFGGVLNRDLTFVVVARTTAPANREQFPLYLGQNAANHVNRSYCYFEGKEMLEGQFVGCVGAPVVTDAFFVAGASLNAAKTQATFYRDGRQTITSGRNIERNGDVSFENLSDGVTLGAATDPVCGWLGDIAEELVFDRQLNPSEMHHLWLQLAKKYGLAERAPVPPTIPPPVVAPAPAKASAEAPPRRSMD